MAVNKPGVDTFLTPMPNYFNSDITNGLLRDKDSVLVQVARLQVGK